MANPKSLRTVSTAIPLELHARLVAYVNTNDTNIGKALCSAVKDLVGLSVGPSQNHRQAVADVEKMRALVATLRKNAPRTYPPTVVTAASKVYRALKETRPSFLSGDPDGHFEREHGHLLTVVSGIVSKAKDDSTALASIWCASERESRAMLSA